MALLRCDVAGSVHFQTHVAVKLDSLTRNGYKGSEGERDGPAPGGLLTSPFSSGRKAGPFCDSSWFGSVRFGASSLSPEDDGTLRGGGLEAMSLSAWNQQNSAEAREDHTPPATQGSPKHIFFVVPAFHVAYQKTFKPLTPREKFDEWLQGTYDPRGLGLYAFEAATLEYSTSDGFCGYGKGWAGYGKCFGAMELDANISSFLGDFLFPVVLHQDPRYFRLGQGPFGRRVGYAMSRVFVTHADSGRAVFFASALSGTVLGAAASNLYYPVQDRGLGHTLSRMGLDLGNTALFNVAAEFWPDISQRLHHVLGRQ